MKRIKILLALAFLCSFDLALFAQETLTLEMARSQALSNSKTLQSALLSVDEAELERKIQSYEMLPSISATAGAGVSYSAGESGDLSGSLGISLSQTVYDGGRTTLLLAIDSLSTQMAKAEARSEYFSVLQDVDSAFYTALEAQASLSAARADLDAYKEHLRLAKAKLEAGIITKFAYLETEAETASRETAFIQAQGALSVSETRLSSLTGIKDSIVLDPVDFASYEAWMKKAADYSGDSMVAFIEAVLAQALANNPDIALASLTGEQAGKEVELARADYLPTVSAGASHSLAVESGQDLSAGSGSLSLSASIPLDFWVTKASVAAKRKAAESSELSKDETWRNLKLEIQSAAYECVSSARSVFSSQKALEYAEGYYESVLELYKLSAASSSDLSDAESLVSSNRSALINARYAFLESLATLRTLSGLDSDELLQKVVP